MAEIKVMRIADAVAQHLQTMILEGVIRPGEKLTSERELAEKLGVSRPTLRDALAQLEEKGLVSTSKAGTVVTAFLTPLSDPLSKLFSGDERVAADYFEYRRLVEAHACGLAAARATQIDRAQITQCLETIKLAHQSDDEHAEAQADTNLHLVIYEAAHNVIVLHIMRMFSDMLRNGIFYHREQLYRRLGVRDQLMAQHLEIGEAILSGDRARSEAAAFQHIQFTCETVEQITRDEQRLEASLRRIDREDLLAD
jgi:GntR family transcriptional regulator, transcriptional repressor for pyruvate dehydrogenase complex